MASNKQFLISTHSGSEAVALEALKRLLTIVPNGTELLDEIEEKLVSRLKNSELPAGYDLKMVEVVGPAIEEVQRLIREAKASA